MRSHISVLIYFLAIFSVSCSSAQSPKPDLDIGVAGSINFLVLGILLLIILHNLALFFFRSYELSYLIFALLSMTVIAWTSYNSGLFNEGFSSGNYIKFANSGPVMGPFLLVFFYSRIFGEEVPKTTIYISMAFTLVLLVLLMIASAEKISNFQFIFRINMLIWSAYLLIPLLIAVIRKRIGSVLAFISVVVLFSTVVHDALLNRDVIYGFGVYLTSYGFGLLIVLQSLMLAHRFSLTFKRNTDLTQNLEIIVEERTRELEQRNEQVLTQKEILESALSSLQQTQDQLIQLEKMASLGRLVAGVAHEINTPLGISITAASTLKDETQKMANLYKEGKISRIEFRDYINASNQTTGLILANMEKAAVLIQSFKQVSVDQSTEQKRKFNFRSYVEDIVRSLSSKLKDEKIEININITDDMEIESYPGAFSQIFSNLILNSLIHGFGKSKEGIISISADFSMGNLNIQFQDNGKGIAPVLIDKIYDPFFTTNKKAGPGLGLHIVYNIITQKLKGTIECLSKPRNGVTFQMVIPV